MRRRARGGTARTRPPSPTRSPETGSRCLPGRRASRSLHGAVSLARHSLKQYLYHYARICEADGRGRRLAELTTGALLLVLGTALSIIGILFFPFLCVGIPLLVVGVILIIAEGGQVTKAPPAMYPGYPPGYAYPPYIQSSPTLGADVKSSEVSGFYKKSPQDRWQVIRSFGELSDAEVETIQNTGALKFDQVDRMIENVVGAMPVPLGIAVNFQVNGRDYLVPMAIEEPSVVAAASNAARMARERGGFSASTSGPIMIGQIQLVGVSDPHGARMTILHHRDEILSIANEKDPMLVKVGGGAKDVEVRVVDTKRGHMVITHLVVDCRDAMGANAVNTMAEAVAPHIEQWTGGRVYLRIISNLAVRRLVRARAVFAKEAIRTEDIPGEDVVEGILEAYAFADADPFRCATHNKGIMNGVAAVGLAQNFAALRALATEGIQRGHMSLHARNVAATVGAVGEEVDRVAEILVKEQKVRMDRAKEVLTELRSRKSK